MKTKDKHLVFVYGTLRTGYNNHFYLETSKWIDHAKTKEKYSMFESGIPFVYKELDLTTITGEVYEVSDDVLYWLDMLEGHPNVYKREEVKIQLGFNKEIITAWLYFYPEKVGQIIESGDYEKAYPRRDNNVPVVQY